MMTQYSNITIQGLALNVNLGWPDTERQSQQIVILDVTLHFEKPPLACYSDQLNDTFCYDLLISTIKKKVLSRGFRLIEQLGFEIYQTVKSLLPPHLCVYINLSKKPAIKGLKQVSFTFGDRACLS